VRSDESAVRVCNAWRLSDRLPKAYVMRSDESIKCEQVGNPTWVNRHASFEKRVSLRFLAQ
jgi:hypothetical protein